jgi:hypothetical protein
MNSRRLDAEEIRDAILVASGQLDRTMGGSLFDYQPRYLDETKDRGLYALELSGKTYHPFYTTRRSVYLPSPRTAPNEVLQLFDGANSNVTVARRGPTTVAPQALFMMNNAVVLEQANRFARRLKDSATDDRERLRLAHRLVLGRAPTEEEIDSGLAFIDQYAATWSALRGQDDGEIQAATRLRITLKRSHHNFRLDEMPDDVREKFEREPGVRLRLSIASEVCDEQTARSSSNWQVLAPERADSDRGTALTLDPDGRTVRVPEKSAMPDTYVIVAGGPPMDVRALRLEVLPETGVEYYSVDHFVLGEVRTEAEMPDKPGDFRPVPVRSAVADDQHITDVLPRHNVSATPLIDGDDETSWPIAPVDGELQTVVLEVDDAVAAAWRSYCQSLFMLNEFVYVD